METITEFNIRKTRELLDFERESIIALQKENERLKSENRLLVDKAEIIVRNSGYVSVESYQTKVDELEATISLLKSELEEAKNTTKLRDPFGWMRSWLNAYAKFNPELDVDKVMDWINQQPMTSGG